MNIPMYSALSMLVYGKALYKNIIIIIIIIIMSNLPLPQTYSYTPSWEQ